MRQIRLKAYGKLNLGLDVIGRRENGYHDLAMVMQTVKLYDTITLRILDEFPSEDGIRLTCSVPELPVDESNIVYKAIRLMRKEYGIKEGIKGEIIKHIPMAAGMAGGSADAACTLIAMNYLFCLGADREKLCDLGVKLGADVPFCVMRGTMLCEGIGEKLTHITPPPHCHILIAKPSFGVSTKDVYEAVDSLKTPYHPDIRALCKALDKGDIKEIAKYCGNTLERVTVEKHSEIEKIEAVMRDGGAVLSMMTGSGPTVFGLFEDRMTARKVGKMLRSGRAGIQIEQVALTEFYQPKGR